jgi:hypothetical protein
MKREEGKIEMISIDHGLCQKDGICRAGFFMMAANVEPRINDFLNLPKEHKVYAALMLGYPRFRYYRMPPRQEARIQ